MIKGANKGLVWDYRFGSSGSGGRQTEETRVLISQKGGGVDYRILGYDLMTGWRLADVPLPISITSYVSLLSLQRLELNVMRSGYFNICIETVVRSLSLAFLSMMCNGVFEISLPARTSDS